MPWEFFAHVTKRLFCSTYGLVVDLSKPPHGEPDGSGERSGTQMVYNWQLGWVSSEGGHTHDHAHYLGPSTSW